MLRMLAAIATLGLCACSGPRRASAPDLPDDFGVSVTVLQGPKGTMEPAWYVLSQDDVLHAALGERLTASPFPPAVRQLSREQVRRVWELVVAGGLTGEGLSPASDSQAASPDAAAVMYVSAVGRRRTFLVPRERRQDLEPVVSELRRVGWILAPAGAEQAAGAPPGPAGPGAAP